MRARIAFMMILAVLLSACGGSATPIPASAPVTQATMDAARDANATIIAASIPTVGPTDTPAAKPTTATNATTRVGTSATSTPVLARTATPAPTRSAGASSASLTQTLQGPQRCVFVRYPGDWEVDQDSGLANGNTDDCPGGASVGQTTRDNRTCDNNSYEDMISLSSPHVQSDLGKNSPIVMLRFVDTTCSDLSGLIKDVQRRGRELAASDGYSPPDYSPVRQQTIAGYPAQCFDASSVYKTGTPVRGSVCFFFVSGSLFTIGWGAEESYWQQSPTVLNDIVASLELHPI